MNTNIIKRLSLFSENEKVAFRKRALIFSFFLILSIVFWFMKALGKQYTEEINYPVRYKNFPSQKVQIGNLPEKLNLKVTAQGYTLLRFKLSSRYLPISFNLNAFTIYRLPGHDSSEFFLQTIYTKDYITKQLSSDFEIISIKPDTLYFRFANIRSKVVPVKPKFTYQLGKQMILKAGLIIKPDSILISGPEFIIDTLSGIETLSSNLGMISRSREVMVKIAPIENLYIKTKEVSVGFNVEQFTEKTIQIPITAINIPDSIQIKTFPQSVQLICQVGLSNYDKLHPSSFKVVVNYNEIFQSETGKLKVEIIMQPDFIRAVNFTPKTVEYLIEK